MRRRKFQGLGERRGEAAIEFAFVLPLLLLITFGLIDFGRALQVQTTLNYAVQAAARCYAVHKAATNTTSDCGTGGDATAAAAYAATIATGLTAPNSCFFVDGTAASTNSGGCTKPATTTCNTGVMVVASLQFNLFPGMAPIGERGSGIPTSVRLGSSACFAWSGIPT